MGYENYKINFDENKKQLIDAFVTILGEEYRDIITFNMNNIVLIDYITNYQYQRYLQINNMDLYNDKGLLEDEKNIVNIYNEIGNKFINVITKLLLNNEIVNKEREKYKENKNYMTPLFNGYLNDPYNSFGAKLEVIEKLGFSLEIKEPYFKYKKENEKIIDNYWNKLFTEEESNIIIETSLKMDEELRNKIAANTGNMKRIFAYFDSKNLLIKDSLKYIVENEKNITRHVVPNYSLTTNKQVPMVFFPTLGTIDSDYLTSFIHEITHAISTNLISNDDKVHIKIGILNFNDIKKELDEYNKKNIMLNEAMTQYIAVLVTNVIIENNLCSNLFSFELPQQRNVFESSYKNATIFFKDFFQENFDEVKKCFMGKSNLNSIGNIPFDKLVDLANLVAKDRKKIDEFDLTSYKTLS